MVHDMQNASCLAMISTITKNTEVDREDGINTGLNGSLKL